MLGCTENNALLSFVTIKLSACPDSFAAPLLMLAGGAQPTIVCAPAVLRIDWLGPRKNEGAWLTKLTTCVAVAVAVLNADVPAGAIACVISNVLPLIPCDWSHALNVMVGLPL